MSDLDRDLPAGYTDALATLKGQVRDAQHGAQHVVVQTVSALISWEPQRRTLRQSRRTYGTRAITQDSQDT
ncbi:hypothetical protein [Tersicoccus phoenicis]|uniref:hypothetical protein n=1 Tax=Tersicoccus phoenicis TaxID=554083 RepID=UPI00117CFC57|nr:hypothetical protein [Tersicoccus phoenicis]